MDVILNVDRDEHDERIPFSHCLDNTKNVRGCTERLIQDTNHTRDQRVILWCSTRATQTFPDEYRSAQRSELNWICAARFERRTTNTDGHHHQRPCNCWWALSLALSGSYGWLDVFCGLIIATSSVDGGVKCTTEGKSNIKKTWKHTHALCWNIYVTSSRSTSAIVCVSLDDVCERNGGTALQHLTCEALGGCPVSRRGVCLLDSMMIARYCVALSRALPVLSVCIGCRVKSR